MIEYEFEGLDLMLDAMALLPKQTTRFATQAMDNALRIVVGKARQYPPATEANRPGRVHPRTGRPMGYYERGRGWWYPIMRKATLPGRTGKSRGAILSMKAQRSQGVAGYKLRQTSEVLGKSWTQRVEPVDGGVLGIAGSSASYAPYVQGEEQAQIHEQRGWEKLSDIIRDNAPAIRAELELGLQKLTKFLLGGN
jgi:hypothetical protein